MSPRETHHGHYLQSRLERGVLYGYIAVHSAKKQNCALPALSAGRFSYARHGNNCILIYLCYTDTVVKPGRPGSVGSPRINNQIRALSLRVIDDQGNNLGVVELEQALALARERELDLIEIAPTATPPVAKIMDYGKFRYIEEKKRKGAVKTSQSEIKEVRIGINTSPHDLELKAKRAIAFLEEGHRIKVELILRGRAKYLDEQFIRGRVDRLLTQITAPFTISEELRKGPRGRHLVIERAVAKIIKKKAAPKQTADNRAHAGKNKQIVPETPEAHRAQESAAA